MYSRTSLVNTPSLYTGNTHVSTPFVGDHSSKVNLSVKSLRSKRVTIPDPWQDKQRRPASRRTLALTGGGLTFSQAVVEERAPLSIPFKEANTAKFYTPLGGKRPASSESKKYGGRYYRKPLCHFVKRIEPEANRDRRKEMDVTETKWVRNRSGAYEKDRRSVRHSERRWSFEDEAAAKIASQKLTPGKRTNRNSLSFRWDEAALQSVSKDTAKYLVGQDNPQTREQLKLERAIHELFGLDINKRKNGVSFYGD